MHYIKNALNILVRLRRDTIVCVSWQSNCMLIDIRSCVIVLVFDIGI